VVSVASASGGLIFAALLVPETLAAANKVPFEGAGLNSFRNLSVLWFGPVGISSKVLFRRLAFCVCVNAMLLDGIYQVWTLYVREQFDFTRQVSLYDSTFSRTVWRLYGGAKGLLDFTRQEATISTLCFGWGRVIVLFGLLVSGIRTQHMG
jgi:hypothetical protein